MKIGICDDEIKVIENLKLLIEECMKEEQQECQIRYFLSGIRLLKCISEFDIVFLDITMPEADGIEIGNKIQKINPHCKIIMETAYVERFKESFKIGAFRFITKPFDKEEIREALKAAISSQLGVELIELYLNRNKYFILQRDIKYIMAYDGYTEFFANDKMYRKETTLQDIEQLLDSRIFFRVNRSYIVNMIWILRSNNENIIIVGKKEIKVSRRNKKEFERAYMEFDVNYGRFV